MSQLFDQFHQYAENLLLAQYKLADIIKHPLVKGEVCEDFLMEVIKSAFGSHIHFKKGVLAVDGVKYHNQMDIMLCRDHCQVIRLGNQFATEPQDVKLIIEVKGNATGNDIKKFNELAGRIKSLSLPHYPVMGMFCYRIQLSKKELLKRFGYTLDNTLFTYMDDSENFPLQYPLLDYIICIDVNYQVYLQKNSHSGRYMLSPILPTISNLFDLVRQCLLQ